MLLEILKKASLLEEKIRNDIQLNHRGFFSLFSPDEYVGLINAYSQTTPYNHIGPAIQTFYGRIINQGGPSLAEKFHQLILIKMMINSAQFIRENFPECITRLFFLNFIRILKCIEGNKHSSGFYLYPNDAFLKDLGICSQRMIPAGNHKLEISGFSRRFITKNGFGQFIDSLRFLLKTKGNKPFYQLHSDTHDRNALLECNPEGTTKLFLRISKLLETNPKIKGIFGCSWMNDPQLERISPTIFSGPKIARANGGKLYYYGMSSGNINGALFASAKRTRLYKEGHYMPANYMMIWYRDDLLNWAKKQAYQEL